MASRPMHIAVAMVLAGTVLGCTTGAPPTPVPPGTARQGEFTLAITTPRDEWATSEAIEVTATLSYAPADERTIWGAVGGILAFEIEELTGTRHMGPVRDAACERYVISSSQPIRSAYLKSGGIDPGEPNEAFYRAYFADPLFHLPPGRWRITAWAQLAVDECGGRQVDLRASLDITVR